MKKFFLFLNIKIVLLITIFSLFYFLVIFIYDLCFYELSKNLKKCVVSKPEEYHQSARSSAKKWMNDLKKDDRKTCLQVAHAEGALHVKNALLIIPEHFRSSIIVVVIAPTTIVSSTLCHKSFHYLSRKDFTSFFNQKIWKKFFNKFSRIRLLRSRRDTEVWNYDFQSPVYLEDIEIQLYKYQNSKIGE
jgi:hypothetical protein